MSLFVVGTSSHVGKSVTVAALCRCLVRRGISVAPFKSQNMSLNSFVTSDGGEIGMAQAMQAFAARIPPATDMNPVLLKPKGDCVSQVVLHGRPYKDVPIAEYYRETPELLKEALRAFRRLQKTYGQVVIEGAGGGCLHRFMVRSNSYPRSYNRSSRGLSSISSGATRQFFCRV